jgi:hypothetical protein
MREIMRRLTMTMAMATVTARVIRSNSSGSAPLEFASDSEVSKRVSLTGAGPLRIGVITVQPLTLRTAVCPHLGVETEVSETAELKLPGRTRWVWWHCPACQGWHLCTDQERHPAADRLCKDTRTPSVVWLP